MKTRVGFLCSALALAALGSPVAAQQEAPGWIGISFEVPTEDGRRASRSRVVITDVRRGSPAEAAGLRAGDRILRINDVRRVRDFRDLPSRLRLRIGDRVRIQVERNGRDVGFELQAAARPAALRVDRGFTLSLETDSLVETMVRAMDSLRIQLIEERRGGGVPSTGNDGPEIRLVTGVPPENVRAPFEFFVFRGQEHDSLRNEMDQLNRLITDLRDRESDRLREVMRAASGASGRADLQDEQLVRLRGAIEDATRQAASLRAAMAEAARATAGLDYSYSRDSPNLSRAESRGDGPFRPLTPYLLGSNRVAGAQVVDLRPELAEYFAVEGGVLIVDVALGTPAAIAGIRPGDVITRLDQIAIRSVEDFRFGVSQADETLPLTLVRQGSSVQVLLRRR